MKNKTHILVVEDEANTRRSLTLILKKAGYKVSMAKNGREAVDFMNSIQLGSDAIDFLLFDIQMPELTGIGMLEEMKEQVIHVPLLAMTGYKDRATSSELMSHGCRYYIEKPFSKEELLKKIDDVMGEVSMVM